MPTPPKRKPAPKRKASPFKGVPSAREKLDALGIDTFCDRILKGESMTQIAESLGITTFRAVSDWLAEDEQRSARAKEARTISAEEEDARALKAITDLTADATPAQIAKAREEAHHRRWRASKRDPARYGDRAAIDLTATVDVADISTLLGELAAMGVLAKPGADG